MFDEGWWNFQPQIVNEEEFYFGMLSFTAQCIFFSNKKHTQLDLYCRKQRLSKHNQTESPNSESFHCPIQWCLEM